MLNNTKILLRVRKINKLNIKIITQNFPPRIGGIQNVMYSLANNFSKLNYNVHVIPDHKFSTIENFRTTNLSLPKIFRPIAKRLYLKYLNETDNIIFCGSTNVILCVVAEIPYIPGNPIAPK